MLSCDDDGDQRQILNDFRRVASAHVEEFLLRKDHVLRLLGPRQNPESGRFREELVREFLRKLLPRSVGVDTGFIYGFEQVGTSDQLDVIIWDHGCHAPILNAGPFVNESRLTTAFEKFVYFLLTSVFHWLASPALSLLSAWGDLNPATGDRAGDIEEIIESEGAALLEVSADTLPPVDG